MGFPDFGKEMHRPFNVDERCYDCAEFYGPGHGQPGCNAMPANPNARCLDYLRLPDVGVDGQTGQEIPPSRMGGRKEPRITLSAKTINDPPADPAANKAKARTIASINPQPERQPSPAGNPGGVAAGQSCESGNGAARTVGLSGGKIANSDIETASSPLWRPGQTQTCHFLRQEGPPRCAWRAGIVNLTNDTPPAEIVPPAPNGARFWATIEKAKRQSAQAGRDAC